MSRARTRSRNQIDALFRGIHQDQAYFRDRALFYANPRKIDNPKLLRRKATLVGLSFDDYLFVTRDRETVSFNPALDETDRTSWAYLADEADQTTRAEEDDEDLFIHHIVVEASLRFAIALRFEEREASEIPAPRPVTTAEILTEVESRERERRNDRRAARGGYRGLTRDFLTLLAKNGFSLGYPYPKWAWRYLRELEEEDIDSEAYLRAFPMERRA